MEHILTQLKSCSASPSFLSGLIRPYDDLTARWLSEGKVTRAIRRLEMLVAHKEFDDFIEKEDFMESVIIPLIETEKVTVVEDVNIDEIDWDQLKKVGMQTKENTDRAIKELIDELTRLSGRVVMKDHTVKVGEIRDYRREYMMTIGIEEDSEESEGSADSADSA